MKNFIETYDNALLQEECKYIIDYMNTGDRLKPGVVVGLSQQTSVETDIKDSFDM